MSSDNTAHYALRIRVDESDRMLHVDMGSVAPSLRSERMRYLARLGLLSEMSVQTVRPLVKDGWGDLSLNTRSTNSSEPAVAISSQAKVTPAFDMDDFLKLSRSGAVGD